MKRLKRNKSIALDGIKAEFLLDVGDMLHVPLQIVFNKLLQQGYSVGLSIRVIHALHKGGDALQFENYKGITVGLVGLSTGVIHALHKGSDALPSPGVNPLEGSPKYDCGKLGLGRRSRLLTLERGRGSSWELRD
jgi:hypothetical protein